MVLAQLGGCVGAPRQGPRPAGALSFAGVAAASVTGPRDVEHPGFVAAAWGIFVYGEISGAANFRVLGLAFVILVVACALIVVSKN